MTLEETLEFIISNYCITTVCLAGIMGNLLALATLLQKGMRGKTTSLYMAVMACSDILILTSYFIRQIVYQWFNHETTRIFCIFIRPIFYSIHYSAALLVAMTVEKYISVKYPLKASVWITRRRAAIVILTLGIVILALNLHHFFYVVPVNMSKNSTVLYCSYKEDNNHFWFLKNIYRWLDASVYCFIPIVSLCILNGLIIKQLILSKKQSNAITNTNVLSSVKRKNAVERQITFMLLATTTTFCILTMPIAIAIVISSLHPSMVSNLTWAWMIFLEISNHSVNVMIYSCGSEQFRKHLKRLICRNCMERDENQRSVIRETYSTNFK